MITTSRFFALIPGRAVAVLICSLLAGSTASHAQPDQSGAVRTAIFAGGCFWCMEPPFDKLAGVIATTSGYTGGNVKDPSYEQVSAGGTGHYEAVRVTYDADIVTYETLLNVYWVNVDPLDSKGQFCDRGSQYLSAIFYQDERQKKLAMESRERAAAVLRGRGLDQTTIVTELLPAGPFYEAEPYHQNYYTENPISYRFYRFTCGRDGRLDDVWGDLAVLPDPH